MSALMFAGASQFVAIEIWADHMTTVGHYLGTLVSDPKTLGLDLVLPAFFIVMLVPLWSGARRAISWAVGGAVALLASALMAGWWFIILGAIAGSITAGFLDERD